MGQDGSKSVLDNESKKFTLNLALALCFYSYLVLISKKKLELFLIWFEISSICPTLGTLPELEFYVTEILKQKKINFLTKNNKIHNTDLN